MFKKIQFLMLFAIVATGHSQKIKIKKGEIFVDKQSVAKIEKIKSETEGKYFQISDSKGEPFCKVKELRKNSLLYHDDKSYPYRIFYGDKIGDTIAIKEKNYYLSEKRIITYLSENLGLIDGNGLKNDKIDEVKKNSVKLPDWIKERIEEEKPILANKGFKVKRFVNDTLILKAQKMKTTFSKLSKAAVNMTKVNIYQKDLDNEILIGYGIHQVHTISNDTYYFIFNTKDVPLSSYNTGFQYKYYQPFEKVEGEFVKKIVRVKNRHDIIMMMAKDLVKKEKL